MPTIRATQAGGSFPCPEVSSLTIFRLLLLFKPRLPLIMNVCQDIIHAR